ncbi:MAG: YcgN family cysteine cluster protein [Halomonas sp.]|uniref:YcgN family cysteine cluster protein n=1 Tax=Halomonas sp. TaxID=1486246 RepID=UPI002ACE3BB1|nr:YcgN family cysteine cluster protein [Halomonas sp.]MDZ7852378.1 YcgN family cysteine cluster protein [Halomonas sp.]
MRERFWERFDLEELTDEEWEALCDGCGQCCLLKFQDDESGDLAVLNVACELLDIHSCRCSDYANRFARVPDCTQLTPERIDDFRWLPKSCAYRRVAEGRKLAAWHPLIAGGQERMHRKGISVRSFAVSQREVPEEELEEHIIAILPIDA